MNDKKDLKILVVEDDPVSRMIATKLLSKHHIVETANDGSIALEMMRTHHYDIVLMDIMMPVMDGIETTIAIRNKPDIINSKRVVIIALTTCNNPGDEERFLTAGMDGYLHKPVTTQILLTAIEDAMERLIKNLL